MCVHSVLGLLHSTTTYLFFTLVFIHLLYHSHCFLVAALSLASILVHGGVLLCLFLRGFIILIEHSVEVICVVLFAFEVFSAPREI
jgi:hypothetical protein